MTEPAAQALRKAIEEAGGVEVFAIGRLDFGGLVQEVEVICRGNSDSVPALLSRPRPGECVIHNHPSGVLQASNADMALAGMYGEDGVGVVIVDNAVKRALWVVEPHKREVVHIDDTEVEAFFRDTVARSEGAGELREPQITMALAINRAFNEGRVAAVEAGTGTGKSLGYLVPAVLWATRNQARVAVATYTIPLQGQLAHHEIPLLRRLGLDFRSAVLQGRSNYLCKRQMKEAIEGIDGFDEDQARTLRALASWEKDAADGSRGEAPFQIDPDVWEVVSSDHDKTLRARCEHFATCHYYTARRAAAAAHVLVLNHHLLLSDLVLKAATGGTGILPRFDRIVLDEAHHLEDAATSLFQQQVSSRAISKALGPLLPKKKGPGGLELLMAAHKDPALAEACATLLAVLPEADRSSKQSAEALAAAALGPEHPTFRLTAQSFRDPTWSEGSQPVVQAWADTLEQTAQHLRALDTALENLPPESRFKPAQPRMDVARARSRIEEMAAQARAFGPGTDDAVRWIEASRARTENARGVLLQSPVDVGDRLRSVLFDAIPGVGLTSATLSVAGDFEPLFERVGLRGHEALDHLTLPSPFDWPRQGMLGLPRDLPTPDAPGFEERVASVVVDALGRSDGGAFVLCTSHQAVQTLYNHARQHLGHRLLLLKQGDAGRSRVLETFLAHDRSVLFATDSFWEGVSVAGDRLRLVILPKLPFRVPTEPVQQARVERLEAQGKDPFRTLALPQAVLRLRQGAGRLIRTKTDRGVVLLLDRRVIDRWYGRVFLASLPPMARVTGPARMVLDRMESFLKGAP